MAQTDTEHRPIAHQIAGRINAIGHGFRVTRAIGQKDAAGIHGFDGLERLQTGAVIRPWLQDFGYTDSQVRESIESAEDFGLGWMLWNAFSNVSEGALDPA